MFIIISKCYYTEVHLHPSPCSVCLCIALSYVAVHRLLFFMLKGGGGVRHQEGISSSSAASEIRG